MFRRTNTKINNDFRKDIPEYSDERIIEILKQRDYYQAEAVKQAVEEAIKREIIFSEQDLFGEEYKVEEQQTSMFPKINKSENLHKIRKSIARSFVIYGVIPVVFGLVQTNKGNPFEGSLVLLFGLLWIYFSSQLIKAYQKLFVVLLITASVVSVIYIYAKLILLGTSAVFDFFLPAALFLLTIYGLLFLKRMHQ